MPDPQISQDGGGYLDLPDGERQGRRRERDAASNRIPCAGREATSIIIGNLKKRGPIPFEESVLYRDDHIVVADKPHFLPVIPSGRYLQETLLVRLKQKLVLDHLVPLHRIDRETAGLVIFSHNPETQGKICIVISEAKSPQDL